VYGALLTPKGMIIVDAWVLRMEETFTLITSIRGHDATVETLRRQLPPRLAKLTDLTGARRVATLHGQQALGTLRFAGVGPVPETSGKVAVATGAEPSMLVGRPGPAAPFRALVLGTPEIISAAVEAVARRGAAVGNEDDEAADRILAGWPALGAEIDDKTLPQEVRYDEIDGVSYTKGCYTGQETVARVHFRGHTNRQLRGLRWSGVDLPEGQTVAMLDGKDVGTLRSTLTLSDRVLGLATVRREVEPGETVVAGGREAAVRPLPFDIQDVTS